MNSLTGTRVYIALSADYAGRVKGLCGNFNGIASDDFMVNGMESTGAIDFANKNMAENCAPLDETTKVDPCVVCAKSYLIS